MTSLPRKTQTIVVVFILLCHSAFGQNVTIPDSNFKALLLAASLNTNDDDEISVAEAEAFSGEISVRNGGISDMTGIEAFINITGLNCSNNQITSLDVSANTSLEELNASINQLTTVDVSNNLSLEVLIIGQNMLPSIDVSMLSLLEDFRIDNNELTSIDVSSNTALFNIWVFNNDISTIDVSQNAALQNLELGGNANLASIDVSNNSLLTGINLDGSGVSSIDVTGNSMLRNLILSRTSITSVDVTQNPELRRLYIGELGLTSVDVTNNTELEELIVDENNLSTIDISNNSQLNFISICCNELTSLDLSDKTLLARLNCSRNNLETLNIKNGNNSSISDFDAKDNPDLVCIIVDDAESFETQWSNNVDNVAFTDTECIAVSSILLSTENDINSISQEETLQLLYEVTPTDATFQEVEWSSDDNTIAEISETGVINPVSAGTTTIRAAALDGSGVEGTFAVTVEVTLGTDRSIINEDFLVYPNPASEYITINDSNVSDISILDLAGKHIKTLPITETIKISDLNAGVYLLQLKGEDTRTIRFIKE